MDQPFKEVQKLRQWWLWLLVILLAAFAVMIMANDLGSDRAAPGSFLAMETIGISLLMLGLCLFVLNINLTTRIDEKGIFVGTQMPERIMGAVCAWKK